MFDAIGFFNDLIETIEDDYDLGFETEEFHPLHAEFRDSHSSGFDTANPKYVSDSAIIDMAHVYNHYEVTVSVYTGMPLNSMVISRYKSFTYRVDEDRDSEWYLNDSIDNIKREFDHLWGDVR